jgi:hypothetical protein
MSSHEELLTPQTARNRLESLLAEVDAALAPHDNIRADDPQYEDPQEWWLRPLKRQLHEALNELEANR